VIRFRVRVCFFEEKLIGIRIEIEIEKKGFKLKKRGGGGVFGYGVLIIFLSSSVLEFQWLCCVKGANHAVWCCTFSLILFVSLFFVQRAN
jgi:hypothetical protein